jgi:hypothetical protein
MSTIAAGSRPGITRWAPLGGLAYVVLFIGGAILAGAGQPDGDAPPAKVIKYYGDSGHRDKIALGWLIVVIAVFFFLWFLSALRQFVRRIDGEGLLTTLATVGGAVYAALTLAGMGLQTAILTMSDDTYRHQVFPGLIHAAQDSGYIMHVSGGAGAAAFIIAASIAFRRAALVPGWAAVIGVIIGVLQLGSVAFFPLILLALWLIAASVLLYRAAAPGEALPGPD